MQKYLHRQLLVTTTKNIGPNQSFSGRYRAVEWRGHFPPDLAKGGQRGRGAFFITVSWIISWFITIDLKQIDCSYSRNMKIQNGFL